MSKFYVWVDDTNAASNCQSADAFNLDNQRKNGFQAGTGASAVRVNTGLRQANLIAVALVEALGIPDTYSVLSNLSSMKSWFEGTKLFRLTKTIETANVDTDPSLLLRNIKPYPNNSISLGSSSFKFSSIYATTFYGTFSGTANAAKDYATSGTIKSAFDTIESRLNRLGFKQGSVVLDRTTFSGRLPDDQQSLISYTYEKEGRYAHFAMNLQLSNANDSYQQTWIHSVRLQPNANGSYDTSSLKKIATLTSPEGNPIALPTSEVMCFGRLLIQLPGGGSYGRGEYASLAVLCRITTGGDVMIGVLNYEDSDIMSNRPARNLTILNVSWEIPV